MDFKGAQNKWQQLVLQIKLALGKIAKYNAIEQINYQSNTMSSDRRHFPSLKAFQPSSSGGSLSHHK